MKIYLSSSTYKPGINDYREHYDPEQEPSLTDPSQRMEAKDILRLYGKAGSIRVLRQQFPELESDRDQTTRDILASYEFSDRFDKMNMAAHVRAHQESVQTRVNENKQRIANMKTPPTPPKDDAAPPKEEPLP